MRSRNSCLCGEKVILHTLESSDEDKMIEMLCDPLIKKTYMLPDFVNEEEKKAFFLRLKKLSEDLGRFVYGIYHNGSLIGFINEVEKGDDWMELGYFISSNHWNKGFATDALSTAIQELFRMGYKQVRASHFTCNQASGKVMQKVGMKMEKEKKIIEYRGENHELVYYFAQCK